MITCQAQTMPLLGTQFDHWFHTTKEESIGSSTKQFTIDVSAMLLTNQVFHLTRTRFCMNPSIGGDAWIQTVATQAMFDFFGGHIRLNIQ